MPKIVLYKESDGRVPIVEWLDSLPHKVQDKCTIRLERLESLGHELRRPEADYLTDSIYELRIRHQRVNYRILYFFYGQTAVVLSHGITKEKTVPVGEIDIALQRKRCFERNPAQHSYEEEEQ